MYMPTFQNIITQLYKQHQKIACILSVEYSLSPENVWPKACDEIIEAYRYLIHDLGINTHKVMIMGDSAGGNLVASTILTLKDQRKNERLKDLPPLSLPAGAVMISPWVDLSSTLVDQTAAQPSVNKDSFRSNGLEFFRSAYIPKLTAEMTKNPSISPLHGDFKGVYCPMFISYGEHEILKPSIESFIKELKESDCEVTGFAGKDQSHIWLMYNILSTTKQVYQRDLDLLVNWIVVRGVK